MQQSKYASTLADRSTASPVAETPDHADGPRVRLMRTAPAGRRVNSRATERKTAGTEPIKARGCPVDAVPIATLSAGIESWLVSCQVRRMSPNTIKGRRWLMGRMLWFLENERAAPESPCDRAACEQFLIYCSQPVETGRWGTATAATERATRPISTQSYFRILRAFFNWMRDEELIEVSPLDKIKTPVARADQIQPLSAEQVSVLLDAMRETSYYPKRNEAIVLLILDTGLRVSEVCKLKFGDLDRDARKIVVIGKGSKRRAVFYGPKTARALAAYVKSLSVSGASPREDDPLFFSERGTTVGTPFTPNGLYLLIRKVGQRTELNNVRWSPHTLRHTFAINFIRAGGAMLSLMELLGHTDLTVTKRYVQLAGADIENQARTYSALEHLMKTGENKAAAVGAGKAGKKKAQGT